MSEQEQQEGGIENALIRVKTAPSIPECSIEGIKPTITPIPPEDLNTKTQRDNNQREKRCCICGSTSPTKIATYQVQGATRIERYCDACIQKQFASS